jgi:Flp pilus assembly protein TadB
MVAVTALWLPILVSAVFVFIVSSVIHMVFGYHANDYKKLPDEDGVADALRRMNIPAGDYMLPRPASMKDMKTPEFQEKVKKGPGAVMTIWGGGQTSMSGSLVQWFLYSVIVGIFAAYVAGRALTPEAHYLAVFRFAGVTAFVGYSLALMQHSIWYKRSWTSTLKSMFDGLLYALVTAGTFGWLWPR